MHDEHDGKVHMHIVMYDEDDDELLEIDDHQQENAVLVEYDDRDVTDIDEVDDDDLIVFHDDNDRVDKTDDEIDGIDVDKVVAVMLQIIDDEHDEQIEDVHVVVNE